MHPVARSVETARLGKSAIATISRALADSLHDSDKAVLTSADVEAAAAFLAQGAACRKESESTILIDSLGEPRTGDGGVRRQRLAIANLDMPFLVDSIAHCLSDAGLVIHLLAHPVIAVRRDAAGQMIGIGDADDARRESLIYIETDRLDARRRHALAKTLDITLAHVRAAVRDWHMMIEAMHADANRLDPGEGGDLLRWLLKRNLTQLGHEQRARDGSISRALGICTLPDEPLLSAGTLAGAFDWFEAGHNAPLILKSNRFSHVHRRVLIDLFIVPVRDGERIVALSIHAGLWTSAALATPAEDIPILRDTLAGLMARFSYDPDGHAAKTMVHALTTLPHDLLLIIRPEDRMRITLTAMSLADRPRPKLELVCDVLSRHLFVFAWMMRDDLSSGQRQSLAAMIANASGAALLGWSVALDDSSLALVRFTFDLGKRGIVPDTAELDRRLAHLLRGWVPAVEQALIDHGEGPRAAILAGRYAPGFPLSYRENNGPEEAAQDIIALHGLAGPAGRCVRLYPDGGEDAHRLHVKVYSLDPLTLSEAVPALENFGFRAIEERSATICGEATSLGHIQRFTLTRQDGGLAAPVVARAAIIGEALDAVLEGRAENDRFAMLIVTAGISERDTVFLRAIFRYMRQAGASYGIDTVVDALRREAAITGMLTSLFRALHDPAQIHAANAVAKLDTEIDAALEQVNGIDDDHILRLYRAFIQATLRTNAFSPTGKEALAFKLDSAAVPGLPAPLPWREIWVYSPRIEGIHMRAGRIARGGLRWSDRRDDFRTETLSLMKAQRVKNAVIVPTGAKGGFYAKQLPDPADRDAWLAEGTESYRIFIRALLSVTDNIISDKVVHPDGVIVRDDDDPYFVVAADKGTASFSDIANSLAIERNFWLGDAFASGGTHGYDHKAMGITARGAWLSVRRHFAEMGIDVQRDNVRVIGVGDMSGDVFGNGMLLSKTIRLIAAFDHRHIFIDPDPDPATSWNERQRIFRLKRSSWDDYDKALISEGGGVFSRSLKNVLLSPAMQALVGTIEGTLEPNALIAALLRVPTDLLWFGGIGTYIKAAAQSHADVRDAANDKLRVNGEDVRASVIGEGANLGVTQAGRIAFALQGGRINADFIDNSAGVDCSDNEVNIKIALNKEVAEGRLAETDRNILLAAMTDDVADIVLEDNRLQALCLSIAQLGGAEDLASYVRLIATLETGSHLDRQVEGLASDQALLRRANDGQGLTRPELAILLSTAKLALQAAIETSELAHDPLFTADLMAAFPRQMRTAHSDAIARHQLRDEIIATGLANHIINRLGILLPFTLAEEASCTLDEVARAFAIVERLFDVKTLWADIDAADLGETARLVLYRQVANALASHIGDTHRSLPASKMPGEAVTILTPAIIMLGRNVDSLLQPEPARRATMLVDDLMALGVGEDLAARVALLVKMDGAIGLALLARNLGQAEVAVVRAFTRLGEALGIDWLQGLAARTHPSDPWERLLVSGSARDLQQMRLTFLAGAGERSCGDHVTAWLNENGGAVTKFRGRIGRAQAVTNPTATMIAELCGQARALLSR